MAIFQCLGGFSFTVIVKADFTSVIKNDEEETAPESVAIGYFQWKQPIFICSKVYSDSPEFT